MLRRLSIYQLVWCLSLLGPCSPTSAQGNVVNVVVVVDKSSERALLPSVEADTVTDSPKPFDVVEPGKKFVFHASIDPDKWFKTISVKLTWTSQKNDPVYEQTISLRLSKDLAGQSVTIPAFFSEDISGYAMTSVEGDIAKTKYLEKLTDVFFKNYMIANHINDHYVSIPDQRGLSDIVERIAKNWFDASFNAATIFPYIVIPSADAKGAIMGVYHDNSPSYRNLANQAKSIYWKELSQIDQMASHNQCANAVLMLNDFNSRLPDEETLKETQWGKVDIIKQKQILINKKCGSSQ
jgi:hypothetical protein